MTPRKTPRFVGLVLIGLCASTTSFASPSGDLKSALKSAFGDDFKDYTWLSFPVDNFGDCTMFKLSSLSDNPSDKNQICATWSCIEKPKPLDIRDEITIYGFVDEGRGYPIQFEEKKAKKFALGLIVKPLLSALGANAKLADSKKVKTTFKTGVAYKRKVNIEKLTQYLNNIETSRPAYVAYESGLLSFVKGDLVLTDIEVTLTVDKATDGILDAALNRAVGDSTISTHSMDLSVSKTTEGVYKIRNPGSAIYAVLTVKQPKPKALGVAPNRDLESYTPTTYAGKK